ncbi:MAG: hypothetical protein MZW92_57835 [Comamonadaceae bacterium]|nr:hypothetical protein [Comamonadaceae bacterium]
MLLGRAAAEPQHAVGAHLWLRFSSAARRSRRSRHVAAPRYPPARAPAPNSEPEPGNPTRHDRDPAHPTDPPRREASRRRAGRGRGRFFRSAVAVGHRLAARWRAGPLLRRRAAAAGAAAARHRGACHRIASVHAPAGDGGAAGPSAGHWRSTPSWSTDDDPDRVAAALRGLDGPVLVSWRHAALPGLVDALLQRHEAPPRWPEERYDLVWIVQLDGPRWNFTQHAQRLLHGDREQTVPRRAPRVTR